MRDGFLTASPDVTANEFMLARRAAETLHSHYPGHMWAVSVEGPMLDVRNLMLAGNWGFRISIPSMYSSSDWDKQVLRAGGEILERYRQRRAQIDEAAIMTLPTNFAGQHKPEL